MALRELPMARQAEADRHNGHKEQRGNGHVTAGQFGSAHVRTRDAYRDVPILKQPTWGHEISTYFFFGGISSGAYALSAVAHMGGERRQTLARTANVVAFAAMLPCPPLLIADLGKPQRFHHMLRVFKPSSPMNLGAWTLTLHGGFATLTAAVTLARQGKVPIAGTLLALLPERWLGAAGLPTALALGGYTGVLLGTSSVPLWYTSPLLGALFMASSMSTGTAAVSLAMTVMGTQADEQDPLARLSLILSTAEAATVGGYLVTSREAVRPLLKGAHGLLLAGSIGALAASAMLETASLLLGRESRTSRLLAIGATLVSGFLLRTAIVGAGKASANDREGTLEAMKPSRRAPGWSISPRFRHG